MTPWKKPAGKSMTPCPPPDFSPKKPRLNPPAGSTDCHFHIYGPSSRYPYAETRGYTPPDCTLERYRPLMDTLGLQRAVLVQPSVYGTDNRAHLDALAEGGGIFRMVAVLDDSAGAGEMRRMEEMGVRGIRFNVVTPGGLAMELLEDTAARIAPLGWHIQMFMPLAAIAENEARLASLPVPLVIDHMGCATPADLPNHPGFTALLRLIGAGGTWVKLSGAYRLSAEPTPPFSDMTPIAQALIAVNPERMVWGSDWPHPMVIDRPMPNDGDLLDLLSDWAPRESTRNRILVDNPARLYRFD